jgi:hypothetical protein
MQTIVFDIETGPLPEAELLAVMPVFDPSEVKTGNLKDPAKIAEKLAEAEANHRRDFIERAALDPLSGRVVAIGVLLVSPHPGPLSKLDLPSSAEREKKFLIIAHEDEAQMLREFWLLVRGDMGRINPLVGFNIFGFDLPFLFKRSWKHRVPVPFGLRRGRYWDDQILDLREAWQLGDRQAKGSLDAIAKHLGVGSKLAAPAANGEIKTIKGGEFAGLWDSNRKLAEAYLRNDVELTALVADALGVKI